MSKALTRLSLALLALSLCARAGAAQTTLEWIVLSPRGGGFTARMPKQPASAAERVQANGLSVSGRRYTAGDGGATFIVWSLKDSGGEGLRLSAGGYKNWHARPEVSDYLDRVAELAWEWLVRPEVERLTKERPDEARKVYRAMEWRYEFDMEGGRPARAYFLTLGEKRGPVYVCLGGSRVYVVAALAADAQFPRLEQFAGSFGLTEEGDAYLPAPSYLLADSSRPSYVNGLPAIGLGDPAARGEPGPALARKQAAGKAGGGGASADYDKPFKHSEVTKKALVTYKPEPGLTESARKFGVTGAVRLRAVLSATGEVKDISLVTPLPHGLTEKSTAAARQIRFEPAQKDGRAVSQYVVLEYKYNIY